MLSSYLSETGRGPFAACHVPDLTPPDGEAVELLFVFESPHAEEIQRTQVDERRPVVGSSGRAALQFLARQPEGESLGDRVGRLHKAGDTRIAIINICGVPLQSGAFRNDHPLSGYEWTTIKRLRGFLSRAGASSNFSEVNEAVALIRNQLTARLAKLTLSPGGQVVTAGRIAQRFTKELPATACRLDVPHPARRQWNSPRAFDNPNLLETRRLFRALNRG